MEMNAKAENLREMRRLAALLNKEINKNIEELKKNCDRKCGHVQSRRETSSGCYYDSGYDYIIEYCDVCSFEKNTNLLNKESE